MLREEKCHGSRVPTARACAPAHWSVSAAEANRVRPCPQLRSPFLLQHTEESSQAWCVRGALPAMKHRPDRVPAPIAIDSRAHHRDPAARPAGAADGAAHEHAWSDLQRCIAPSSGAEPLQAAIPAILRGVHPRPGSAGEYFRCQRNGPGRSVLVRRCPEVASGTSLPTQIRRIDQRPGGFALTMQQ